MRSRLRNVGPCTLYLNNLTRQPTKRLLSTRSCLGPSAALFCGQRKSNPDGNVRVRELELLFLDLTDRRRLFRDNRSALTHRIYATTPGVALQQPRHAQVSQVSQARCKPIEPTIEKIDLRGMRPVFNGWGGVGGLLIQKFI